MPSKSRKLSERDLEALEAIYATQADALNAQAELELLTGTKLIKP